MLNVTCFGTPFVYIKPCANYIIVLTNSLAVFLSCLVRNNNDCTFFVAILFVLWKRRLVKINPTLKKFNIRLLCFSLQFFFVFR